MKNAILKEKRKKNIKEEQKSRILSHFLTAQESTAKEVDFAWPDQNLWSQRVSPEVEQQPNVLLHHCSKNQNMETVNHYP